MSPKTISQPDAIDVGLQLGNAIYQIVNADMRTAYANRTVGDFKRALELLGAKDSDPLASIEYGVSQYGSGYVQLERDEDGAIEVREVSRTEVK